MELNTFSPATNGLSDDIILEQLQKIVATQAFAVSEILRNFLNYIVRQTLAGGSESIKEYTIAIYVLNKPPNFKPHYDCGVRVHARRLRVALDQYYMEEGKNDDCIISIPKGRYVADFKSRKLQDQRKQRVAIIPFKCYDQNNDMITFSDMLSISLNTRLSMMPAFSVVPFHTTGLFISNASSLREIVAKTGAEYILAGSIFRDAAGIRIFAELIDGTNDTQIWSEMKKFVPVSESLFDLSDQVVNSMLLAFAAIKMPTQAPETTIHQNHKIEKPVISLDLFQRKRSNESVLVC